MITILDMRWVFFVLFYLCVCVLFVCRGQRTTSTVVFHFSFILYCKTEFLTGLELTRAKPGWAPGTLVFMSHYTSLFVFFSWAVGTQYWSS